MAYPLCIAPQMKKYDVFFSFRREDTRDNFVSHLDAALRRANIGVFISDEVRGEDEEIPATLCDAIEQSEFSVVVFSKRYASSTWCLEELAKIMYCKRMFGQIVIPVFYRIDRAVVENQTGTLADDKSEKVQRWRTALKEAVNITDTRFDTSEIWRESVLVENIVKHIFKNLPMDPSDKKDLVGVQSRIMQIESVLRLQSKDACIVGIWGKGGIGKTTIARAIFDKFQHHFDNSFFALNVKEASTSPDGLNHLQRELLSEISKGGYSNKGFTVTRQRLYCENVLIVFDDVVSLEQINFLIGDIKCLGLGSRIIITGDEAALRSCGVDDINMYEVKALFHNKAIQLFSWYAFQQNCPASGYDELSNDVVKYAEGVPLALKVLGSFLRGQTKKVWETTINDLKEIPHRNIQQVLKVSYDGLDDDEKNIFLDIACGFFVEIGISEYAMDILAASGFFVEIGISDLVDKSLITVSQNKIMMHDLLQKMGCEIVRQESLNDPGKRSRLWDYADIIDVLSYDKGTKAIEAICLDMSKFQENNILYPCALTKMRNLRFLKVYNSHCKENAINKMPVCKQIEPALTELRYLCWHGCPLKSLQSNIHLKNLVALDLPHSEIKELWTGNQHLDNLKRINLSHSRNLQESPDFSCIPNLEILLLEGCTSLLNISPSIQCLNKLAILSLRNCENLVSLPPGIHSKSLRKVILSFCSKLETLPDISHNTEELYLDKTAIQELPSSIENLSRLVRLNLKNCSRIKSLPSNICKLTSLRYLSLSDCSELATLPDNLGNLNALKLHEAERFAKREVLPSVLSSKASLHSLVEVNLTDCCIEKLPDSLFELSLLEILLLGGNKFVSIPTKIIDCPKLSYLDLGHCERLQSLPELPYCLQYIDAYSCKSLDKSSLSIVLAENGSNATVNLINCFNLKENVLQAVVEDITHEIHHTVLNSYSRPRAYICWPGQKIPKWFNIQTEGSFIDHRHMPSGWFKSNFVSFAMCAIVAFRDYHDEGQGLVVGCDCRLESGNETVVKYSGSLKGYYHGNKSYDINSDHIFLGYDYHKCYFDIDDGEKIDKISKDGKEIDKINKVSIKFYVEDLNKKRADGEEFYLEDSSEKSAEVKMCGVRLLYKKSWSTNRKYDCESDELFWP